MKKKSFFIGAASGAVLMFVILWIVGMVATNNTNSAINYFETPLSYNKQYASFKVFQVLQNDAALAFDETDILHCSDVVLLIGNNFYDKQIVEIVKPQIVGTFNYQTKRNDSATVPVIVINQ